MPSPNPCLIRIISEKMSKDLLFPPRHDPSKTKTMMMMLSTLLSTYILLSHQRAVTYVIVPSSSILTFSDKTRLSVSCLAWAAGGVEGKSRDRSPGYGFMLFGGHKCPAVRVVYDRKCVNTSPFL